MRMPYWRKDSTKKKSDFYMQALPIVNLFKIELFFIIEEAQIGIIVHKNTIRIKQEF